MTFIDELASGVHSLRVTLPPSLELIEQHEHVAAFREHNTATGWWFLFFPDTRLVLDAEHLALHRRDTLHHTRALFETMHRSPHTDPGPGKPRTADPDWTPLIELEPGDVAATAAVSLLHRMTYWPGQETIMGHTLIPAADGLFEARWVRPTLGETGLRETLLVSILLQNEEVPGTTPQLPRQEVFDAPEHDAQFPDHPLSRARRAKTWHVGRVEVTAAAPRPLRTYALAPLDLTVTVPPRFQLSRSIDIDGTPTALFDRVSFSGSDGVDRLVVARGREPFRAHNLRRALTLAANRQSKTFLGDHVADPEPRTLDDASSREAVTVVTEGDPRDGGTRTASSVAGSSTTAGSPPLQSSPRWRCRSRSCSPTSIRSYRVGHAEGAVELHSGVANAAARHASGGRERAGADVL